MCHALLVRRRGLRSAVSASVLFAVVGGAAVTWWKVSTTRAYVALADDMGRPARAVAANVARPTPQPLRVVGQLTKDPLYGVALGLPDDCRAGFDCEMTLKVLPREGWRANLDAPFKFKPKVASREPPIVSV